MDHSLLEAALVGLKAQRARIDEQIATVEGLLGKRGPGRPRSAQTAEPTETSRVSKQRKRRKMSAEARQRMAEAQKKRWAAYRKATK